MKNLDKENEILEAPTHEKVASLKCVALSQEGVVAFVCEKTILVTNFRCFTTLLLNMKKS